MSEIFQRLTNYLFYFTHQLFSKGGNQTIKVLYPCRDPFTEIIDNIYIGDYRIASNLDELYKNDFKHILNCTYELPNEYPGKFDYLNINLKDEIDQDLKEAFPESYEFLKKNKGEKTLVHCIGGFSRSVALVMYYLMKEYGYTYHYALNFIAAKRKEINPNSGFRRQLLQAERELLGDKAQGENPFGKRTYESNPLIEESDIQIQS